MEAGPGSLKIFFKLVAENENKKIVSLERKTLNEVFEMGIMVL